MTWLSQGLGMDADVEGDVDTKHSRLQTAYRGGTGRHTACVMGGVKR